MRLRKGVKRVVSTSSQPSAGDHEVAHAHVLGKRGTREDEDRVDHCGGRRRLIDSLVFSSSLAGVNMGQPRCQQ
ncbi:hypothetical protein ACFX2G_022966 [Malus domestica]